MSILEKLSEQQLTRQPEEVFDILCKLGKQLIDYRIIVYNTHLIVVDI
jgi:hypothetical protein